MSDLGLTHIAYTVSDLEASLSFFAKYAGMEVVHDREDPATRSRVAWISDHTRPFVIVLIELPGWVPARRRLVRWMHRLLPPFAHLGVACESREKVDDLCSSARQEGVLAMGPKDMGPPVGYFALIRDPDGAMLEVAHGQDVGLAVEAAHGEG